MSNPSPILRLREVGVVLNRTPILRAVNLDLAPREVLGVVGPNGSGKTTLLRVLATLLQPTTGAFSLGTGVPPSTTVELIGHAPAVYPELTLHENLAFVARLEGRDPGLVDRHLHTVGLGGAADRRADRSSRGMQRRIDFARALIRNPELLLLDEAHAGLDVDAQELVRHVVADVVARDGAVVMVSHEPDRMRQLATRVVHLSGGTLTPGAAA